MKIKRLEVERPGQGSLGLLNCPDFKMAKTVEI